MWSATVRISAGWLCREQINVVQWFVDMKGETSVEPCSLKEMATGWRSHRLFDLLILAPELLGLVDPLTLVFWKSLQVQLKSGGERVSARFFNKTLHKHAETLSQLNSRPPFPQRKLPELCLLHGRKNCQSHFNQIDRTAWSIWQLPSSIRSESGCSSVDRWCLPAGSWPGNYCWGTSRPILSCRRGRGGGGAEGGEI